MATEIPQIFRIIIPVSNINRSLSFYTKLLGIEARNVGGGRYYFDSGGVILALLESDRLPIAEYIYFAVADVEAFYKRADELECLSGEDVHGAPAREIVRRPWGELSFYAYDPDGNGLCFVDEKTLFKGR